MQNIKKIYNRLTKILVKERSLVIFMAIQNVILALVTLIYTNVIISNAKVSGELNFVMIKLFYNFMMSSLLFFILIYAPYFLSKSINVMIKNYTFEYLLSARVKPNEFTYASYMRGVINIIVLIISSFPIVCVSFYFGGVGMNRAIKYIVFLLFFIAGISAICVFISALIKEINLAVLVSYVICFFIVIIHVFRLQHILSAKFILIIYIILDIFVSILLIFLASRALGRQYK